MILFFPSSVSDRGDHHLRLFGSSVDWEGVTLISQLYSLYQGTVATPAGKKTRPQVSWGVTTVTVQAERCCGD